MEFKFNVTGYDRKRLVASITEITECPAKYQGAPSFAYEVDYITIDKNGTVSFDDRVDSDKIEMLIEALLEKGFELEARMEDETEDTGDSLIISYPRKYISDTALENLCLLVASKESLIKKALGTDALPIDVTDEVISFPWFVGLPQPEEINAYAHFTGKLIDMAKHRSASPLRKRISTTKSTHSDASCYVLVLSATSTKRQERYCFAIFPAAARSGAVIRRCRSWPSASKQTHVSTTM